MAKSELEEKRSRMNDLEQQVAELTMQTEYQLRLKDLHVQVSCWHVCDMALSAVFVCWPC